MTQTYREYQPTGFDARGLALPDRQDWLVVPVQRNRESGLFDEHNFEVALATLGGESDTVEVHRFGHWACGWYEIILVSPEHAVQVQEIADELAQYPLLDELGYETACWEAARLTWDSSTLRERIAYCVDAGVSIFAARREFDMPEKCFDTIVATLE